jgi:predicted ATPase
VLAAAEARGDQEQVAYAHFVVAIPEYCQGKFASSLAHGKLAMARYDPAQHDGHVGVLSLGNDNGKGAGAIGHCAWNLWHLGRADAARESAREMVALARRLDPFSLAYALCYETWVHWLRRDVSAWRECAAEVIALSETHGFPLWLGLGRAWRGAARVMDGDAGALPEILDGMALIRETGKQSGEPRHFALLAEAQQTAGQPGEAQRTVATALAVAAQTGQPFWDADLHRLDGDLLLATGGLADEATARYHRALAIAREQGARSFELRAATSLARLWRDRGKRSEARELLAPIYAWFTEGFDTRDLQDAKALLEELR